LGPSLWGSLHLTPKVGYFYGLLRDDGAVKKRQDLEEGCAYDRESESLPGPIQLAESSESLDTRTATLEILFITDRYHGIDLQKPHLRIAGSLAWCKNLDLYGCLAIPS